MVYTTLARSYKGGGFNPISPESEILNPDLGGDPSLSEFDPEYINSIEFGSKSRFFNNSLQANLTAFYYDYEDLQVSKIFNQTSVNENMDATILGMEAELLWAPNQHWNFMLNLSYLDTELDDYLSFDPSDPNQMGTVDDILSAGNRNIYISENCPDGTGTCPGIPVNVDGNQLPNAPEYSAYLAGSYSWFLDNGMRLDLSASYYYQDEFYTRIFNTQDDLLDSWDVWNASTTLTSADESWYGEAWIRNIGDEDHWTGQYLQDAAVGLYRTIQLLEPRTYGVTFGYRF